MLINSLTEDFLLDGTIMLLNIDFFFLPPVFILKFVWRKMTNKKKKRKTLQDPIHEKDKCEKDMVYGSSSRLMDPGYHWCSC